MSTVHREIIGHGHGYSLSPALSLLVLGGGLLAFHVVRAVSVRPSSATRWLRHRGLLQDPRSADLTVQYLLRLRWARVATTMAMIGVCAAAVTVSKTWISFVSLPLLLSVLLAESFAPEPRRGRHRTASLERRASSYFAPVAPLQIARLSIAAAALSSLAALVVGTGPHDAALMTHGAVMVLGFVALEACLVRVSRRALPDRNPDLALDTAMRVSSARTACAAALVFGSFGLFLAVGMAHLDRHNVLFFAMSQLMTPALLAAVGGAIALVQPLTSWHPRARKS